MAMNEPMAPVLPWGPIYTVTRSDVPEISVQGIVYIWAEDRKLYANSGHSLLRVGDTRASLWSRSLLKPFQLMVLYPTLKATYPQLTEKHYALMSASQSGDDEQIQLLREILDIGGLEASDLKCAACQAMNGSPANEKSVLNHPCTGKHLAHLLYQKTTDLPLDCYLSSKMPQYQLLRQLLDYLLNKEETPETIDGCGMPNYGMNAVEIAQLYHALVMPVGRDLMRQAPDELTDILACWDEISAIVRNHPTLIGGQNRLDTRLMGGFLPKDIKLIAKEGADGMLAVGIGPNAQYNDGLGIFIKVASGYEPKQLALIVEALLLQLNIAETPAQIHATESEAGVLKTRFHFNLSRTQAQA